MDRENLAARLRVREKLCLESEHELELQSYIYFGTARDAPQAQCRIELGTGNITINCVTDFGGCISAGRVSSARALACNSN
jgi:hypothetical protein